MLKNNLNAMGGDALDDVTPRRERRVRDSLTSALLAIDILAVVLTIFQVHGTLRYVAALIFGFTVPGWSVVGFLKIRDVALLVSLTLATSLAAELVLGEFLLARWWHLQLFEMMLGAACGYLLTLQLRARPRPEEIR